MVKEIEDGAFVSLKFDKDKVFDLYQFKERLKKEFGRIDIKIAKRKTKSVGAGVYKGSIKAAKSFNKRRIRLKKTIIKKLRRYL